ncbi:hypothetical protein [Mycobacteroides abscessus]|uniref:hypothetical protein n=1 Tax=Mycobacteroides abscessus TaxID=36809 RepID=UPI000C262038|nr:hypothetical protein [Mycobacteroides abscessus]
MTDLTEIRQVLIESALPDWVHTGGYPADSNQGKTETLLRDMATRTADTYLAALDGKYAIVALEEPHLIDEDGYRHFSDGSAAGEVSAAPGTGIVCHGTWEWSPEQAEDVARQWLSAAHAARASATPLVNTT